MPSTASSSSETTRQNTNIEASNQRAALRHVRHGAGRELRLQPPLHPPVDDEGDEHRHQQHEAHHRALVEVLLAHHLLVDVDGQHVEVAADHLRDAEIADGVGEHHHRRADETVLRAGQRDREELPPRRRAQRLGDLVEAPVGEQQRGEDDHQRVRKRRVDGADDDPDRTVHRGAAQQPLEQALVAEPLDERDRRQQRRGEDRRQRDDAEQRAPRHAGAGQRIGVGEGERHGDGRHRQRHPQRVPDRVVERAACRNTRETAAGRRTPRSCPAGS